MWLTGMIISDREMAEPISGPPYAPPSSEYLLGTDAQGRQMLPLMVWGVPLTLRMGLIAGSLGLLIGTILGFTAGFFGGIIDTIIRSLSDIVLTIPALAVLVVVASTISADGLSVESMAFIIAALDTLVSPPPIVAAGPVPKGLISGVVVVPTACSGVGNSL